MEIVSWWRLFHDPLFSKLKKCPPVPECALSGLDRRHWRKRTAKRNLEFACANSKCSGATTVPPRNKSDWRLTGWWNSLHKHVTNAKMLWEHSASKQKAEKVFGSTVWPPTKPKHVKKISRCQDATKMFQQVVQIVVQKLWSFTKLFPKDVAPLIMRLHVPIFKGTETAGGPLLHLLEHKPSEQYESWLQAHHIVDMGPHRRSKVLVLGKPTTSTTFTVPALLGVRTIQGLKWFPLSRKLHDTFPCCCHSRPAQIECVKWIDTSFPWKLFWIAVPECSQSDCHWKKLDWYLKFVFFYVCLIN